MKAFNDFFVGSSAYGVPHIIMLLCFAFVTALLLIFSCTFAKSEKAKTCVIKIVAGVTLLLVVLSRFIYNDFTPTFLEFLPNTYCNTMGFVMPIAVLLCKKDSKTLYYTLFAAFMGGMITIFSGDDIGQLEVENTIISYAYHSLMAALFILSVSLKYCKPTLEKLPRLLTGFACMICYGAFSNQVFHFENNMYLNAPLLEGTILSWWLVGLIMIGIATIIAVIYELFAYSWKEQTIYKVGVSIKKSFQYVFCKKKDAVVEQQPHQEKIEQKTHKNKV